MIFNLFVQITQLNSRGPDATSACQVLFARIYQNLRQSCRPRPGFPRLDLISPKQAKVTEKTWQTPSRCGKIGAISSFLHFVFALGAWARKTYATSHWFAAGHRKDLTSSLKYCIIGASNAEGKIVTFAQARWRQKFGRLLKIDYDPGQDGGHTFSGNTGENMSVSHRRTRAKNLKKASWEWFAFGHLAAYAIVSSYLAKKNNHLWLFSFAVSWGVASKFLW